MLGELAASTPHIDGVTVCSQMGGLILADHHGRPRTNYLSWRDQRVLEKRSVAESLFDELKRRTSITDLETIGKELRPGNFRACERRLQSDSRVQYVRLKHRKKL